MNANSVLRLIWPAFCHRPPDSRERIVERLTLYPGEVYRVPATFGKLRVLAGRAYVTQAGKDVIAGRGREVVLDATKDVALVSALKCDRLIVEFLGNDR